MVEISKSITLDLVKCKQYVVDFRFRNSDVAKHFAQEIVSLQMAWLQML